MLTNRNDLSQKLPAQRPRRGREAGKRNILGGNAIRLFNLQLGSDKLARVA